MVIGPNKQDKIVALEQENSRLRAQVAWFKKELFGPKSERRLVDINPDQLDLLVALGDLREKPAELEATETVSYQRGKAKKQRGNDCLTKTGLRFDDSVPVEVIKLPCPELEGPDADNCEVIDIKVTHKLAQRPAAYVVLQYEQPVVKRKQTNDITSPAMPSGVLEKSMADVSFLAGMLIDKFQYHLPLYRQHQRLQQSGIQIARSTLTNLSQRSIELLMPIVQSQLAHVLQSKILAIDETPIKATRGKTKTGQGKMKTAWFWPMYGDSDEIVFTYSETRGIAHLKEFLADNFSGTMLTDGYPVYDIYQRDRNNIKHAQCWSHTRRYFIDAEVYEPEQTAVALHYIRELYRIEAEIKSKALSGEKKQRYRIDQAKVLVDTFFEWCNETLSASGLLPDNKLMVAVNYALNRQLSLKVFLEEPDLPIDTNHLERQIRPIPMGRKNWLFCWTELGARHLGVIQSLISTCKLQEIDPYTYLVDVLQRVSIHPAKDVIELTPRVWKEKFASNPMRSALGRACQ